MASRRDELNAYSFARKRTNAAFLKPLPNGSIESAPRPLKAVVPSVLVGVLILVGFGACGILKPVAPQGVGRGREECHRRGRIHHALCRPEQQGRATAKAKNCSTPILNLASANLLLDPNFKVVKVKESELDGKLSARPGQSAFRTLPTGCPARRTPTSPRPGRCATAPAAAATASRSRPCSSWAARTSSSSRTRGKLDLHQALYVEDPDGKYWLVDQHGMAFQFSSAPAGRSPKGSRTILSSDASSSARPSRRTSSQEWMDTVIKSPACRSSHADGSPERGRAETSDPKVPAGVQQGRHGASRTAHGQKYVVVPDGVEQVSNFVAKLLLDGANATRPGHSGSPLEPTELPSTDIDPSWTTTRAAHRSSWARFRARISPSPWPTEAVDGGQRLQARRPRPAG